MKIGFVGCGALGSFYAARLTRARHDVHCLLRSDLEAVRRDGIEVRSPEGDFRARPHAAADPREIGVCDVVMIGLKTTANAAFRVLLPPLVGPATSVVTLQNGLGNEEELAALFGSESILGGLCFVCLNRIRPGVVVHTAHGRIVLGELARPSQPRTHAVAEIIRSGGVRCDITDDLRRAHWEKLVWNIPFNGLGVAGVLGFDHFASGAPGRPAALGPCLSTQDLLADSRWEAVVRELMLEVIATANAEGIGVGADWAETQISRTRSMGDYRASTLVDFERGQPLELDSIFLRPLRCARASGARTPWLERLGSALSSLNPGGSCVTSLSQAPEQA
jgi:2-dehydropantoate 2-reductase